MAFNKFRNKTKDFMSKKEFTDSGVPTKEITRNSDLIQVKAFRDLSFGSTLSVKVDPNTQASRMSQPYAIIARTNTVMDGVYPGEDNLAGVVLEQLMNSNNSKLVNNYDSASLKLKVNYLYLNIDGKNSQTNKNFGALNKEMGNAINEALATTDAEMVTQLPFSQWKISSTSMPDMDSTNKGLALVFYQTILQNIANVLAKYTQLRSLESHLIDMGFRREAPFVHKLFGLLKKASFVAILNSLSNYIVGEYFDTDWHTQNNNLCIIPSRKAKCVRHALLSIKAVHKIPDITVTFGTGKEKIFSTSDYVVDVKGESKQITIQKLFEEIIDRLDQSSVLSWARRAYSGISPVQSMQSYFNSIVNHLTALDNLMARFSGDMNDLRSYLDVMNRIQLNNWKKGVTFDVSAVQQIEPAFNQICHNVFVSYLSSPDKITWDEDTQRWKFHVLWNEFTGIPLYDKKTGGAFLTFSVRTPQLPAGAEATDSRFLIPRLFNIQEDSVVLVARSGLSTPITYEVITSSNIKQNTILSRLIPFESMNVDMRMPVGSVANQTSVAGPGSALYDAIETTFGFGKVYLDANKTKFDISLNRDYVTFLDVQMGDVANAMITYARTYSPFRVWTRDGKRSIGFGSN